MVLDEANQQPSHLWGMLQQNLGEKSKTARNYGGRNVLFLLNELKHLQKINKIKSVIITET